MERGWVDIGGRARIHCWISRTSAEHTRGLQGIRIHEGEGMLFIFRPARTASFWMATVEYPIDILFADASGILQKIVAHAQPGTHATWSYPVTGAVLEVPGGFVAKIGAHLGDTLTLEGRRLGWIPSVKRGAAERNVLEVDEAELGPALMEAAARAGGAPWKALVLNDKRERAVVTPTDVGQWLHTMGLDEAERTEVFEAATSPVGLEAAAKAWMAAGEAETAQVVPYGSSNILVLTRRRQQ